MIVIILKSKLISILVFVYHKGYQIRNQVYSQKNLNVMISYILPINTNNLYRTIYTIFELRVFENDFLYSKTDLQFILISRDPLTYLT